MSQSSDLLCDDWIGVDYHNHFSTISANILNSLWLLLYPNNIKQMLSPGSVMILYFDRSAEGPEEGGKR